MIIIFCGRSSCGKLFSNAVLNISSYTPWMFVDISQCARSNCLNLCVAVPLRYSILGVDENVMNASLNTDLFLSDKYTPSDTDISIGVTVHLLQYLDVIEPETSQTGINDCHSVT